MKKEKEWLINLFEQVIVQAKIFLFFGPNKQDRGGGQLVMNGMSLILSLEFGPGAFLIVEIPIQDGF